MIITKTNVLDGVTPTIQDPGTNQTPANITNPDHSLLYTCGTLSNNFRMDFGAQTDVEYVAVSGHNGATVGDNTIVVLDNGTSVASATLSRDHNAVITFTKQSFTDLQVRFEPTPANPSTAQVSVSYVAAGEYITLPNNGEQAGYKRAWMARSLESRAATNIQAAPIASTKRRKPLKLSLSIPNATTTFSRGDWMEFLDFAEASPFFVRENDSLPESSYICFNPVLDTVRANSRTRALDSINLKFDAYNGL